VNFLARKAEKQAISAVVDLFENPDADNLVEVTPAPLAAVPVPKAPSRKRSKPAAATAVAGQGYLPGLSRRGRPRLKNPLSASDRAKAHRERHVAEGGKRLEILLTAEVNAALEGLVDHFQEPRAVLIARLIQREANRIQRKKPTA
jgi:hypothetical protein